MKSPGGAAWRGASFQELLSSEGATLAYTFITALVNLRALPLHGTDAMEVITINHSDNCCGPTAVERKSTRENKKNARAFSNMDDLKSPYNNTEKEILRNYHCKPFMMIQTTV